ncbi:LytR/AlgR family response regulator transcription factor [Biformimicrobium ophioploci]|uniref:Alginate biosynthesis regulator AlgR n=1 Tax=Biformimicrobium ophioploci TaxID=3036711 RepID=A0ABQ6LV58_9GAMM|nr:LytTR family DNA-binding domain-containing protein [Microbulbifer sp. NKW57]GMG85941.1 alginate biosynthesis regulator AlgR [Microbulbifer sp. NKW57]
MKQLGVLIVDDEPLARARLARMLEQVEGVELLGEAGDAEQASVLIERLTPDLVLLDIEMPGRSGLELGAEIATMALPPALVFCTAHDEFALPAFSTNAAGYLLKPVEAEQLHAVIARARRATRAQAGIAADNPARQGRGQLRVTTARGMSLLPVERVRCFLADSKYVTAYHDRGESVLDESLKDLEREFGDRFLRVHRNALVATEHIAGLEKDPAGQLAVVLSGVSVRPQVSRRLAATVRDFVDELASSPA